MTTLQSLLFATSVVGNLMAGGALLGQYIREPKFPVGTCAITAGYDPVRNVGYDYVNRQYIFSVQRPQTSSSMTELISDGSEPYPSDADWVETTYTRIPCRKVF